MARFLTRARDSGITDTVGRAMKALRKNDWLCMQEFLLRLHTAPSLADLPATILGGLREVIPYDSGSLQDDRGGLREIPWLYEEDAWPPAPAPGGELGLRMMSHWEPEFSSMREAFFVASAEHHPHSAYHQRTGDGAARRLSEIISMERASENGFL